LRAAAPKWSTSSCNTNGCGRCHRSARSSASSGGTAIPSGGRAGARAANPTRRRELGSQAICSKPIWWGRAILRGPRGITRFYSVHTVAIIGRGVATTQGRHKTAELLCEHFVRAWRALGPPRFSQMDNEMAATGGGRYPHSFSLVMRLHLLLGVHLLFIPPGAPGRNAHVESFNDLWQERVLQHPCPDLRALRRTNQAFLRYYHFGKPHRALRVDGDGTRYPGPWLARHRAHLRTVPPSFSLAAYRNTHGRLRLPLARGRVSFVRSVDPQGAIDINGKRYVLGRRLVGRYITATIFTHRRMLGVRWAPVATSGSLSRFPNPSSPPSSRFPEGGSEVTSSRCDEGSRPLEPVLDVMKATTYYKSSGAYSPPS
jgi:hypothetical protein